MPFVVSRSEMNDISRLTTAAKFAARGVPPGALTVLDEVTYDEIEEVLLCEHFHWTLDDLQSLGHVKYERVRAIVAGLLEGRNKG